MSQIQNQLVTVPFNGEIVIAALVDGKPYVPMKPICNNLGLDWKSQHSRIQRNEVMAKGMVIMTIPSNGGEQEMTCLPLTMLNGWLFGVDVNRVKPELRDKLIKYQTECFDVLAQYFMPAVVQATQPQPAPAPAPAPASAREQLNAADMNHLKRIVWFAARNFHRETAANQGIWCYLRQVTHNPAPNAYGVEHIPMLAAELRRVIAISDQISQITQHVETEAIKRIFRKGDVAEKVLAHLAAEAARRLRQLQDDKKEFPAWMEGEMLSFTERKPSHYGCTYMPEQPDFFRAA